MYDYMYKSYKNHIIINHYIYTIVCNYIELYHHIDHINIRVYIRIYMLDLSRLVVAGIASRSSYSFCSFSAQCVSLIFASVFNCSLSLISISICLSRGLSIDLDTKAIRIQCIVQCRKNACFVICWP